MKKISILVVAPYPEFGELAVDIAKAYPQINVYVAPGIYQNAIEYTQIYPSKKFDCIISRLKGLIWPEDIGYMRPQV